MSAATYRYRARTADGMLVRGTVEAASVDDVIAGLRTRALFVTGVEPEGALVRTAGASLRLGRPSRRALLAFYRAFATLVRAGVPLRRALGVTIARAGDRVLAEDLRAILADVEHGAAVSDAFGRRTRSFAPLYVAMIRAGEAGGILDDVLDRLATFLERDDALRKRVRAALAYPAVVIAGAIAMMIFLLVRIVPTFAQLFDAFRIDLPVPTRILLAVSSALQQPLAWCAAAAAVAAAAALAAWIVRTAAGARIADRARLAAPVLGPLMHKAIASRLARMLATLLRAGVDIVAALDAVRPIAGSPLYADALAGVDRAVREGDTLSGALADTRIFDPLAVALVAVGEETGRVDEMLLAVATAFEADVEAAVATLGAVVEPAMIAVLGVVVGAIVFSVFIPLYSLIGSVSR